MPSNDNSLAPLTIGATTIALLGMSFSRDILASPQFHSGLPYATHIVVPGANPRVTFRCYFQDIYAIAGLTIYKATTFSAYLSKYTDLIRDASSVHARLALASSAVAAVQILSVSVDQDGVLIAECEAVLLSSDGITHPWVYTSNNALPALSAEPVKHTLGPAVLTDTDGNATALPGVTDVNLSLNPSLIVTRSDGDLYPRVASQVQGAPRLAIGHKDPRTLLAELGLLGANQSATAVQYFRRFDATTGVAGASNGISFTMSGRAHPGTIQAEQGALARDAIEVIPTSSTTSHPVTVSTSATVPAAG